MAKTKSAAAETLALAAQQFIDAVLSDRKDGETIRDQVESGELGYLVTYSTKKQIVVVSSVSKREQSNWLGYETLQPPECA